MNLNSVDSDVSDDGDNEFIVHAKNQACSIQFEDKRSIDRYNIRFLSNLQSLDVAGSFSIKIKVRKTTFMAEFVVVVGYGQNLLSKETSFCLGD